MNGFSNDYNLIFEMYVNKDISCFMTIREELKQWLVNERETKSNLVEAIILKEKLIPLINLNDKLNSASDIVETCSFNLNNEFKKKFLDTIDNFRSSLGISQLNKIIEFEKYIESVIKIIHRHMNLSYKVKSKEELLANIIDDDFLNTLNRDIQQLKNKINELLYTCVESESLNRILKSMRSDINGLESSQKHIFEYLRRENKIHEADIVKHYEIEGALIEKLRELKNL